MNWIAVTIDDDDQIIVYGIFDSEESAKEWANDAEGSLMLLDRTFIRPILVANPIERAS
jgi:hypothetical protein